MILNKEQGGFAFIVFVMIMAVSLLVMIVEYSEKRRRIADNVREIINTERGLQSVLLCTGYISNTLSKYPQLNTDLILNIKSLIVSESFDKNYWINGVDFNGNKIKGDTIFNCRVLNFDKCVGTNIYGYFGIESGGDCDYKAVIAGNNSDEGVYTKVYVEWKMDEYRSYISTLNFVN